MPGIIIRDAVPADANFIAKTVLCAIGLAEFGLEHDDLSAFERVCSREDTLYSYKNARIAAAGELPVGCLVSYPGELYEEARDRTWNNLFTETGFHLPEDPAAETVSGEFYLDSLAVVPEFRGHEIGKLLLKDGIEKGKRMGYKKIGLIVDSFHPKVRDYYATLGFIPGDEMIFFGEPYTRMNLTV